MIRPIDLDYVGKQNLFKKDKIDIGLIAKHIMAIVIIFISGWIFCFI